MPFGMKLHFGPAKVVKHQYLGKRKNMMQFCTENVIWTVFVNISAILTPISMPFSPLTLSHSAAGAKTCIRLLQSLVKYCPIIVTSINMSACWVSHSYFTHNRWPFDNLASFCMVPQESCTPFPGNQVRSIGTLRHIYLGVCNVANWLMTESSLSKQR